MSEQQVVEGQAFSRSVLEALNQGRTPDWAAFDRAYRDCLLRVAAARLKRYDQAGRHPPEEVLNGFLAARVFPPARRG